VGGRLPTGSGTLPASGVLAVASFIPMTEYNENDPGPLGLRGVEIMSAFIDDPDSTDLVFDTLEKTYVDEGDTGLVSTSVGLWHVSAWLLVRLAKATGQSEREVLQQMAKDFAAR
jgi:hypothetical protein